MASFTIALNTYDRIGPELAQGNVSFQHQNPVVKDRTVQSQASDWVCILPALPVLLHYLMLLQIPHLS